jgi:predicted MFS family arabinose efflux permease
VPAIMVVMYLVYSASAYPFGVLVDRADRYVQLTRGVTILVAADLVLAFAGTIWMTALGAEQWGLQMGVTQGLLSTVAPPSACSTSPSASQPSPPAPVQACTGRWATRP